MLERATYGPVITAIDAGHVSHGKRCVKDGELWPCAEMVKAQCRQPAYAAQLAREKAIEAGKLSMTGALLR